MTMSTNIYTGIPPKCKNPECNNNTYWRKAPSGMSWSIYCDKSCYYAHKSILCKGVGANPQPKRKIIQQKCLRPSCNDLVKLTRGLIQGKYCSNKCSTTHTTERLLENRLNEPLKVCATDNCTNIVSNRNKHTGHWLCHCSKACERKDVVSKNRLTCIKKYGVENPMQDLSVFNKQGRSNKRFKDYVFPSGNIARIQGFENKAIDELLKSYNELDIVCSRLLIPKIPYTKLNGRPAKYYPDIYIPKDNLIIEVKSKWTYSGKPEWLDTNLLKQQATLDAGYNFKFLIY